MHTRGQSRLGWPPPRRGQVRALRQAHREPKASRAPSLGSAADPAPRDIDEEALDRVVLEVPPSRQCRLFVMCLPQTGLLWMMTMMWSGAFLASKRI